MKPTWHPQVWNFTFRCRSWLDVYNHSSTASSCGTTPPRRLLCLVYSTKDMEHLALIKRVTARLVCGDPSVHYWHAGQKDSALREIKSFQDIWTTDMLGSLDPAMAFRADESPHKLLPFSKINACKTKPWSICIHRGSWHAGWPVFPLEYTPSKDFSWQLPNTAVIIHWVSCFLTHFELHKTTSTSPPHFSKGKQMFANGWMDR